MENDLNNRDSQPVKKEEGKNIGKSILLVEDDSFLQDICSKKLIKEGFEVIAASDGEQALAELDKKVPDLILLDIILPTTNGYEVLEKIKVHKNEKIRKVPIIMLSNLGQDNDIKKALDLGATDYLVKAHFTTEEITDKIKEILKIS